MNIICWIFILVLRISVAAPGILEVHSMCPVRCNCNVDKHGTVIADCSKAEYSSVPGKFPDGVHAINMDENYILRLRNNTFQRHHFKVLKKLSFSKNRMTNIDSAAFTGLNTVQTLDLSDNNIKKLSADMFVEMTRLRLLNLRGNARLPCFKLKKELRGKRKIKILCDKKVKRNKPKKSKVSRPIPASIIMQSENRGSVNQTGKSDMIVLRVLLIVVAVTLSVVAISIYCKCGTKKQMSRKCEDNLYHKVTVT